MPRLALSVIVAVFLEGAAVEGEMSGRGRAGSGAEVVVGGDRNRAGVDGGAAAEGVGAGEGERAVAHFREVVAGGAGDDAGDIEAAGVDADGVAAGGAEGDGAGPGVGAGDIAERAGVADAVAADREAFGGEGGAGAGEGEGAAGIDDGAGGSAAKGRGFFDLEGAGEDGGVAGIGIRTGADKTGGAGIAFLEGTGAADGAGEDGGARALEAEDIAAGVDVAADREGRGDVVVDVQVLVHLDVEADRVGANCRRRRW
jgi:hypothetical protein